MQKTECTSHNNTLDNSPRKNRELCEYSYDELSRLVIYTLERKSPGWRYSVPDRDHEDLIQNILIKCTKYYDPDKGALSTFLNRAAPHVFFAEMKYRGRPQRNYNLTSCFSEVMHNNSEDEDHMPFEDVVDLRAQVAFDNLFIIEESSSSEKRELKKHSKNIYPVVTKRISRKRPKNNLEVCVEVLPGPKPKIISSFVSKFDVEDAARLKLEQQKARELGVEQRRDALAKTRQLAEQIAGLLAEQLTKQRNKLKKQEAVIEDQLSKIEEMRAAGKSWRSIAKNCENIGTYETIRKKANASRIVTDKAVIKKMAAPKSGVPTKKTNRVPQFDVKEAARLRAAGYSYQRIADTLGTEEKPLYQSAISEALESAGFSTTQVKKLRKVAGQAVWHPVREKQQAKNKTQIHLVPNRTHTGRAEPLLRREAYLIARPMDILGQSRVVHQNRHKPQVSDVFGV
jgi:hypothetical protein